MNHFSSLPPDRASASVDASGLHLQTGRNDEDNGRSLLITTFAVILAYVCVVPAVEYAFNEPFVCFKFFLVTLALALFFQRYHTAYTIAADIAFAQLLRRKSLAWGATFLFTTLVLVLTELKDMPRTLSFSVVAVSYVIDTAVAGFIRLRNPVHHALEKRSIAMEGRTSGAINYRKLLLSLLLLLFSCFTVMVLKADEVRLYSHYEQLIVVIVTAWLLASALTRPFGATRNENVYFRIAPAWKLGCITALLVSVLYLYGDFEHLSRGVLFGTVVLFTVLQLLAEVVQGREGQPERRQAHSELVSDEGEADDGDDYGDGSRGGSGFVLEEHLPKQVALDGREDLRTFLNETLPQLDADKVAVLFSSEREDLRHLSGGANLLINLEALNFVAHLNPYLATIYRSLGRNGYFVTWFYPLDTMASRVRSQMPKSVFVIFYPLYFFVFRIAAGLPLLDKIVFYITRGRRSDISKAELLGRLAYAGFSVLQSRTINERVYVIARADRKPIERQEPSSGPIAKLDRIGLHGEKITIYKLRTMYPYSEFIQRDVFGSNGLDENGKFMNDFRITSWGRVMRKYWLDELPQLYNWLRGDISLVGVRAISRHYFSLYSKEMQAMRLTTRPGLIPPLYADMPRNFAEIMESERKYITERSRRPLVTDMKYISKALHNIIFKGARSA